MSFAPGEAAADTPASGPDSLPSVWRMRSLPGSRSVRMMFPLGRNARLHGTSRLSMRVVTLNGAVAAKRRARLLGKRGRVVLFLRRARVDRLALFCNQPWHCRFFARRGGRCLTCQRHREKQHAHHHTQIPFHALPLMNLPRVQHRLVLAHTSRGQPASVRSRLLVTAPRRSVERGDLAAESPVSVLRSGPKLAVILPQTTSMMLFRWAALLMLMLAVSRNTSVQEPASQTPSAQSTSDPLPSWNDGPARTAILDCVRAETTEGSAEFVAVAQRIATFDNDGTLWSEQPMYFQVLFAIDRVRATAADHPERNPRSRSRLCSKAT